MVIKLKMEGHLSQAARLIASTSCCTALLHLQVKGCFVHTHRSKDVCMHLPADVGPLAPLSSHSVCKSLQGPLNASGYLQSPVALSNTPSACQGSSFKGFGWGARRAEGLLTAAESYWPLSRAVAGNVATCPSLPRFLEHDARSDLLQAGALQAGVERSNLSTPGEKPLLSTFKAFAAFGSGSAAHASPSKVRMPVPVLNKALLAACA